MNNGWVKLHRKVIDHPRFAQPGWLQVWVYLLASATHQDRDVIFGQDERITLKPGQLVTGSLKIASETGLSRSKVERILKGMEIEQQIGQRTCSKGRLVSITNWDDHQQSEQQSEQRADSERTAGGQRADSNKKVKKVKKVKNGKNPIAPSQAIAWTGADGWGGITDKDRADWGEAYPACNLGIQLAQMSEWLKANPAKARKSNWRRFITNWLGRQQERGGDAQSNKPQKPNGRQVAPASAHTDSFTNPMKGQI